MVKSSLAFENAIGTRNSWTSCARSLEQGVRNEAGKAARICVFSGPLFFDDDSTYSAVQVALSCFKVVAWYNAAGQFKTTAFRLSQEKLVGGIEFEGLNIDKLFKLEQKPVTWIERATGLTLAKAMKDSDTFAP